MDELKNALVSDLLEKAKEAVQHFDNGLVQLLEVNGQPYVICIEKYVSADEMLKQYENCKL